jgi:hypothetical protein
MKKHDITETARGLEGRTIKWESDCFEIFYYFIIFTFFKTSYAIMQFSIRQFIICFCGQFFVDHRSNKLAHRIELVPTRKICREQKRTDEKKDKRRCFKKHHKKLRTNLG